MRRPLTPDETVLYRRRLSEAETALHQLLIGKKSVSLNYNGESVTYVQSDEGKIRSYIAELSAALGLIRRARRPGIRA
ncbi:MAG: gpW family head-tail joining protein [Shinella sp.]|nr:gpW family head-tail joining protein [Shinella sp.]